MNIEAARLAAIRIWLPLAIAVAGLALLVVGGEAARGAGVVFIGVAALVVLANVLMRLALSSERDREREDEHRRYFSRHGRWPDDADRQLGQAIGSEHRSESFADSA